MSVSVWVSQLVAGMPTHDQLPPLGFLEERPLPLYMLLETCHPRTTFGPLFLAPNPIPISAETPASGVRSEPNLYRCDQETEGLLARPLGLIDLTKPKMTPVGPTQVLAVCTKCCLLISPLMLGRVARRPNQSPGHRGARYQSQWPRS